MKKGLLIFILLMHVLVMVSCDDSSSTDRAAKGAIDQNTADAPSDTAILPDNDSSTETGSLTGENSSPEAEEPSSGQSEIQPDNTQGNAYPVVLVHGFMGWGRDEMGGPNGHFYWGGWDDLQEIMKDAGHDCHTAAVGPFSSNWDRACELYAQLTGTRTDYGLVHAQKNGHSRFGKDFTGKGLLSQWDSEHKIHIISHSQGGQTARMMAQLLEQGYQEEMQADYSGQQAISPLFDAGQNTQGRIYSITTLATPHNGTSLANAIVKVMPTLNEIIYMMIQYIGIDINATFFSIYDFKFQHFGLTSRQQGEKLKEYFERTSASIDHMVNDNVKDLAMWDLSPEGAREINAWVHSQEGIYYFSYSDESSHADSRYVAAKSSSEDDNVEYYQMPDANSFSGWFLTGPLLGVYTCNDADYTGALQGADGDYYGLPLSERVTIDSSWWVNDGVVNTISMNGPWLYPDDYNGPRDVIVEWDGASTAEKGVWNHGGVLDNIDHFDITGTEFMVNQLINERDNHNSQAFDHVEDWLVEHVEYLKSLP